MASSGSESESFEVTEILDSRKRGRTLEYLVRWKGFGEEDSSWEPNKNLKSSKKLIDEFNKKSKAAAKTPAKGKSTSKVSAKTSTEEKTVAKTKPSKTPVTTRTTSYTKTTTSRSEMSSPESSPVIQRRSVRTKTEEVLGAKGDVLSRRSITTRSGDAETKKGFFHLTAKDVPILILIFCLLLIASTFVFEYLKKHKKI